MGVKNIAGIRRVVRDGKSLWVIDFRYTDHAGARQRFRRDPSVQLQSVALAEAKRYMQRAAEKGSPDAVDEPEEARRVVLREFYETTFATHFVAEFRPSTNDRSAALWRQSVGPYFGDTPVGAIGEMQLRAFATTLKAKGVQLKGPLNFVKTLLRAACDAGLITEAPRLPPKLIKVGKKLPDTYEDEELWALRQGIAGWLGTAVALSAFAGMRLGEVRAIEVRDVDLRRSRLYVRRAFSHDVVLTPKSGSERIVPLCDEIAATVEPLLVEADPTDRLVLDENGETPRRQEVLRKLKQAQSRLGLPERSFHALRHYFCSSLVRRGASLEAVRVLAGHGDLAVTQRYVHATASDLEAAIAKLGKRRK